MRVTKIMVRDYLYVMFAYRINELCNYCIFKLIRAKRINRLGICVTQLRASMSGTKRAFATPEFKLTQKRIENLTQ